jgi:lipoic acid synthetase
VDRDDMPDGGAGHFAETIRTLKVLDPKIRIEALVSDFQGNTDCVRTVAESGLDVYAHNIETVERLQGKVRDHRAGYMQSLATLEHARRLRSDLVTKSSIMLGVGEKDDEVFQAMRDLRTAGVEIVTFGQYLRPTRKHMRVYEYVPLEKYDYWKQEGEAMGFAYVASAPLVRSSYKAGEFFINAMITERRAAAAAKA